MVDEPIPEPVTPTIDRRRTSAILGAGASVFLVIYLALDPRRGPGGSATVGPLRVDPNRAPPAVLESLPRIGPTLAGRLVTARESAPFRDLDDLDRRVPGFGPATVEAIRPLLRFDDRRAETP